ncbi:SLBB domain-containing protein [Marinomonas ushuaiensis]|nr:SLBB domain-containing protein [Marinomonas ushuaiensis]
MALVAPIQAFTPTAAQISQFQNLPKAQQEQLARQYGVDVDSLLGGGSAVSAPTQQAPVLERTTSNQTSATATSQNKNQTSGLKSFGYEALSGAALGFTVVDNLPVPLDYQMGPGDVVNVQVFGKSNQKMTLKIDRDGTINLPDLGPVSVAGQTFEQLRAQLVGLIKQTIIGVDVAVSMGTMRTMQVYIVGEVSQPGAYNVNGLTTITQAIVASGGVKNSGSLRQIQLKRKGKVVSELDLYDLLIKGDTSKDVRLSSGDTLFIPTKASGVELDGEVVRPAIYELKGRTTLAQLLALAGGPKPQAYLSRISVRRMSSIGSQQFTVDLKQASGRNFILQNGDEIRFGEVSNVLKNAVAIRGEVVSQGAMNFTSGMRISDAIGSIEDDLKQSADLNYALLVREGNKNQDIEVHQFSLLKALSDLNSIDNLLLQEKDQIFVFNNGLDLNYWGAEKSINLARQKGSVLSNQTNISYIDSETGAEIVSQEENAIGTFSNSAVSATAKQQQGSRAKLLEPIIERLADQASYDAPALLVDISGAVKFPGTYPLVKNATAASLVVAAGGLTEDAYLDSAELSYRGIENGRLISEQINFSLKDAISGKSLVSLSPQDHLAIKTRPDWQEGMLVELQGEVVFPGRYTFQRGDTIKDLIGRAGGFTEFAYPKGAVFSRERLKRQEAERLKYLNAQLKQEISNMSLRRQGASSSDPAQALSVLDQLDQAEPVGRLVVNIDKAMKGDELANLMLEKDDKLYIPALNPVISVVGEVQYGSHHTFDPNKTVDDYIASAGGTKRQADTGRIYIVKSNGSVEVPNNSFWFSRKYQSLAPGDAIIVPINTDYLDGLSTLSTATQILYQLGVAWSAVKD